MKKEIVITKLVVRVDSSKEKNRAIIIGFDKEGNEYELYYYDSKGDRLPHPDVVITEKRTQRAKPPAIKGEITN